MFKKFLEAPEVEEPASAEMEVPKTPRRLVTSSPILVFAKRKHGGERQHEDPPKAGRSHTDAIGKLDSSSGTANGNISPVPALPEAVSEAGDAKGKKSSKPSGTDTQPHSRRSSRTRKQVSAADRSVSF